MCCDQDPSRLHPARVESDSVYAPDASGRRGSSPRAGSISKSNTRNARNLRTFWTRKALNATECGTAAGKKSGTPAYTANSNTRNHLPRTICAENAVSWACFGSGGSGACAAVVFLGADRGCVAATHTGKRVFMTDLRNETTAAYEALLAELNTSHTDTNNNQYRVTDVVDACGVVEVSAGAISLRARWY
eukprot:2728815-Rhodomonas_salina.1